MKILKKMLSCVICFVMILSCVQVLAYEDYPQSFWEFNTKYRNAIDANDHAKIIEYGKELIDIVTNTHDEEQKKNDLVSYYDKIANSYAALGDYDNALIMCSMLYDYASQYGDEFYDQVKTSKARILQYKPEIQLYTDGGQSPYFGAVNEKENGVLFGICANGETRSKLNNESMVLTYQELGQKLLEYNVGVMKNANSGGQAVEFALNCPKQGNDIRNIKSMDSYLKEISDLFKKYPNVPVYLRFAAEFDVWKDLAKPNEFKSAYRYVSRYFKDKNDNVAMVWSPNYASGWYINTDDYYPGDEYVDWIGVSLYAQKYLLGGWSQEEGDEVVFKAGDNSNPVIAIKEIVEKYGDRKPIMLSESGCGHRLVKSGEDTTAFALQRLKEYYSYLPMVYPQIKLIAYFDWYVNDDSEKYDFRLSTNKTIQNEYLKLVKGQRFIQDSYDNNTDFCYKPIRNGSNLGSVFEVSCYAHLYGAKLNKVTYYIDDIYEGMSNEIPYTAMIDASAYSGNHQLRAVAEFDNGKTLVTVCDIKINNAYNEVVVEIDNEEVYFDQKPIIYNDRTMVPMRKIFEALGAKVTWDGETQTVTGTKGDRTVKVTIGQNVMYVNKNAITLDAAPFVLSGRTMVPARAIAEGLGCKVDWYGEYSLVSITPKKFSWSDWTENLPSYVNEDMYYIEKRDEYRYRTCEKEYYTLDRKISSSNYIGSRVYTGEWSSWGNEYISSSDTLEVETRQQSSPKEYFYAHYCTGNEPDESIRYRTANYDFCNECIYHSLGWYSSPLPAADDGVGYIQYKEDGKKYRCSNTCYRWYVFDTRGGSYTQYRSRPIYYEHRYYRWTDWSYWSSWSTEDPHYYYDYYDSDTEFDIDERTMYRYKEKG